MSLATQLEQTLSSTDQMRLTFVLKPYPLGRRYITQNDITNHTISHYVSGQFELCGCILRFRMAPVYYLGWTNYMVKPLRYLLSLNRTTV